MDLSSNAQSPLAMAAEAQMDSALQPRPSKILPIDSDLSSVAVFFTDDVSSLPCTVMSKIHKPIQLYTESGLLQDVPPNSLLRFSATPDLDQGRVLEAHGDTGDSAKRRKVSKVYQFKVALFGLPWSRESFVKKAVNSEHPFLKGTGVPLELQKAIEKHVEWSILASFASSGWTGARDGWSGLEIWTNKSCRAMGVGHHTWLLLQKENVCC